MIPNILSPSTMIWLRSRARIPGVLKPKLSLPEKTRKNKQELMDREVDRSRVKRRAGSGWAV